MKRHIVICFFLFASVHLSAQKDTATERNRHFFGYVEMLGHNYYGFKSATETGYLSANFACRILLGSPWCVLMASGENVFCRVTAGIKIFSSAISAHYGDSDDPDKGFRPWIGLCTGGEWKNKK